MCYHHIPQLKNFILSYNIKKYKIVIFIDSCFWHYCPIHCKIPKSNTDFWTKKLTRTKERDEEITSFYIDAGWHILRIWEHEINANLESTVEKIMDLITRTIDTRN
jgi:DNA mismatch endonuclease (patch repair protein)